MNFLVQGGVRRFLKHKRNNFEMGVHMLQVGKDKEFRVTFHVAFHPNRMNIIVHIYRAIGLTISSNSSGSP